MATASGIRAPRSWPLFGAVIAAIGASSCCILPIIGAVFGVSTLSAGTALGSARPLLLLSAAVFLFLGARSVLAGRDTDACGCEGQKKRVFPAVLLVTGVVIVVGVLAFVPELLVGGAR